MAEKDFTPREMEIMAKAWLCFDVEPKVDFNKLASEVGMTNPRSASNAWAAIKKKIQSRGGGPANGGDSGTASPVKPTPKKATPRKRGKAATAEAEEGDEESPTKKVKGEKGGKKGAKAKGEERVEEEEGEGEDEGVGGKVKEEPEFQ